jgi:hypothetical protein
MYIDDKWNSYTFGRPVNMEAARSHIPPLTFDDEDPDAQGRKSGDISAFIALSRLSCVLENLIPLLLDHDGGSRKYGRERAVLAHAASELGAVYRDLPRDLEFMPSSAGYPARPGGRE